MVRGMAARRLVIVLLILLGIAIFATVLAPVQSEDAQTPTATTRELPPAPATEPIDPAPPPTLALHAGGKKIEELPLDVDRAVSLDVYSKVADTVEIPGMGLTQAVDPSAPAHFELLPDVPGTFNVKLLDSKILAGKLVVSPEARPGSDPKKQSSRRERG
jgi:heme/copper-type cytochrome/quinol oxidase subunit 2